MPFNRKVRRRGLMEGLMERELGDSNHLFNMAWWARQFRRAHHTLRHLGEIDYGVPNLSRYSVEFMKPLTIERMSAGLALMVRSQSL